MIESIKTVTVFANDGTPIVCEVIGNISIGENNYVAVQPPNIIGYWVYRYENHDNNITLFNIEENYIASSVIDAFNTYFKSPEGIQNAIERNNKTIQQLNQVAEEQEKGCLYLVAIGIIVVVLIAVWAILSDNRERAEQHARQQARQEQQAVRQAQQETFGIWSIRNRGNIRFVNAFLRGHNRATDEVFMVHLEYHRNPDAFAIYLVEVTGIFGRRNINIGRGSVSIIARPSGRDPVTVSGFTGDGHTVMVGDENARRLLNILRAEGNMTITVRGTSRTYITDTFNASGFNNISRNFN